MSSIVCHGLQSCLETSLIEPHVLRLKVALPEPNSPQMYHTRDLQENCLDTNKNGGDLGGWSFIQSITNKPNHAHEEVATENDVVYVHPLVKRSSSKLSEKSLEMCTESLGSETGSDISDDFSHSYPSVNHLRPRHFSRKPTRSCSSFPPPLTSISGSDGVRVRPHREHGRLVLKAETVASNSTYLQAERVNGRLRLCMKVVSPINCAYDEDDETVDKPVVVEGCYNNELCMDDDNDVQNRIGDVVRINGSSGPELETGEFARPRRCKEGSGRGRKGMQSWGAVWVASS